MIFVGDRVRLTRYEDGMEEGDEGIVFSQDCGQSHILLDRGVTGWAFDGSFDDDPAVEKVSSGALDFAKRCSDGPVDAANFVREMCSEGFESLVSNRGRRGADDVQEIFEVLCDYLEAFRMDQISAIMGVPQ